MPKRIKIGNLNATTTAATMYSGFVGFGAISRHCLDCDEAGASLGVGHIVYATVQAGTDAITAMNNTSFDGAVITVCEDL